MDVLNKPREIAAAIRERIVAGMLTSGQAVRDGAAAAEFGVSRNTAREALGLLHAQQLLDHAPNRGYFVRRLTAADVTDIYRVRRVIEERAIEEAATASETARAHVSEVVAAGAAPHGSADWEQAATDSLEFHRRLVSLLASPSLDDFFAGVLAKLRICFALAPDAAEFQAPWLQRDADIWQRIQTGDRSGARAVLRHYLDDSEAAVLDLIRSTGTGAEPMPEDQAAAFPTVSTHPSKEDSWT